jgi:hypothetical protein
MTASDENAWRGDTVAAGVCDEIVARMKHDADPARMGRVRRVAVAEVFQYSLHCRRPPLAVACSILRVRTP